MEKQVVKEQLSALLDGELDVETVDTVLQEAKQAGLIETVDVYLQIRDVLQGEKPYRQPSNRLLPAIRERLKEKSYLSVDLGAADVVEKCKPFTVDV
ncbi:MAG: sigma-E factor negative regulatory protein [Oxalobacter formigenes]|nr:sigma-E factor negative regulatory protein [Oxalobacter formigenes]